MDFRTDKLLHGGDYNPEQWLKRPDILEKDISLRRGFLNQFRRKHDCTVACSPDQLAILQPRTGVDAESRG